MRVIAVIDDPRVVEEILRHLGAWHDPPAIQGPARTNPVTTWTPPRITGMC